MPTLFSALLDGLGLSQSEAAAFLETSVNTVKSWSAGRRPAPQGVLEELHALASKQERAAEEAAALYRRAKTKPAVVELGLASDDREARSLGWPCVSAQLACFRRVFEKLPAEAIVRIVPRGSTPGSAAAADAHERKRNCTL